MYNFLVVWDSGMTSVEKLMIRDAVNECMMAFPNCFFHIYGKKEICRGASMDMAVANATRRGQQIDAYSIVRYFEQLRTMFMPSLRFYTIAITSHDLYPQGMDINFCFGMQDAHGVVQSVARYRHLNNEWLKKCIAHVLVHEMGHMFGAAYDRRGELGKNNPLYEHHCEENGCVMQQVMSVGELLKSIDHGRRGKDRFCVHCRMDMAFKHGATIMHVPSKRKVY